RLARQFQAGGKIGALCGSPTWLGGAAKHWFCERCGSTIGQCRDGWLHTVLAATVPGKRRAPCGECCWAASRSWSAVAAASSVHFSIHPASSRTLIWPGILASGTRSPATQRRSRQIALAPQPTTPPDPTAR